MCVVFLPPRNLLTAAQTTVQAPLQHGTGFCPCESDGAFLFSLGIEKASVSLFSAGVMTGFDASGHIAEETKNAR
jgi:hypothetical protein